MWNYSPGKPSGGFSSHHHHVGQHHGGYTHNDFGIGDPNGGTPTLSPPPHEPQGFGMDGPAVTWGHHHQHHQEEDGMGSSSSQLQQPREHEDVDMDDDGAKPAGVGNLIAHFDSISRAPRKASKGGAPSRVTSPAADQFPSHSRIRGGSIGRPPPVRFGTMGQGGGNSGGMRVMSPVMMDGHGGGAMSAMQQSSNNNNGASNANNNNHNNGGYAMSMSMGHASNNHGPSSTPSSADAFGHDRMGSLFANAASTASAPFGFGPGMGGIGGALAGHSLDSYGVHSPTSPFGSFDFGATRMASPTENSPMVDSFGNVDDLARFGDPAAFMGHHHHSAGMAGSPMQSPATDGFGGGGMASPTSVGATFINTSVSTFRNIDPFKSAPQTPAPTSAVQQQQHMDEPRGNGSFGDLVVQEKQENQVSSTSSAQFGSINAVAGGNSSTSQQRSSPDKDFRPPLPPRKTFLHGIQPPGQNQGRSQSHPQLQNNATPSGSQSTPGFNVWRPPLPTTPKPILAMNNNQQHQQHQPAQLQPNDMYFQPGSKMDHVNMRATRQHQQMSDQRPATDVFIKSEQTHHQGILPAPPHQQATFSIQNPASLSLRSQGAKPTREQVPAEAWESYKPTIRQLYLEERRPLKEVIQLMADRHGFQATPKMYKTRFSQWGFVKNNTEEEVKRLLSMKFQRDAKGKVSEFVRNGRVINLGTYLKRKGVTEYDLVDFETPADLPTYVRCRTPTPPPAPGYLRSPDLLRAQETVVGNMRKAFLHCRQHELDAANTNPSASKVTWASMMLWGAGSSDLVHEASRKFAKPETQDQGGALLIEAFKQLETDLCAQPSLSSPQGIQEVLLAMVRRDAGMTTALCKYLAAHATTNLERAHPLRQIFTTLYEVQQRHGPQTLSDLVWGCMPTVGEELEAIYQRDHPYVARAWIDLAALYGHADSDRLLKLAADLQPLRRELETTKSGSGNDDKKHHSAEAFALRYAVVQLMAAAAPDGDETKREVQALWATMRASGEAYAVLGVDRGWCFHDPVKAGPSRKRCRERYKGLEGLLARHVPGVSEVRFYFEEEMHDTVHEEDVLGSAAVGGGVVQQRQMPQRLNVSPTQLQQQQQHPYQHQHQQQWRNGSPSGSNNGAAQDPWAAAMDLQSFGGRGHL